MEYHKHFIDIAESESPLLDIITSSFENSIDTILSTTITVYKKNSNSSLVSTNLKLSRLILCHHYKLCYDRRIELKFPSQFIQFVEIFSNDLSKTNLSNIIDIIILILVGIEDKKNLTKVFEDFQLTYSPSQSETVTEFSLNWNLKIFKCFLVALELLYFLEDEKKLLSVSRNNLESIKDVYISSIMKSLTIWIQYSEKCDWYTLHYVLEKIVSLSDSSRILNSYILEILDHNFALTVLCVLCDLLFPLRFSSRELDYCLINNKNLWLIIKNKVISNFSQERKQALYLFQNLCDFIDANKMSIKKKSQSESLEKVTPFICNQNKQKLPLTEVKTNFVFIIEALEEKQQHLVVPVMPYVNDLIEIWTQHKMCESCFQFDWIYCIFVRLLNHDSNVVVKWALLKALKLDVEAYKCDLFLSLIMKTLNNTFLYEKLDDEKESQIVHSLTNWFNNLQNEKFFLVEKFISLLNQNQWGPIAIFHILQSVFLVSENLEYLVNLQQNQLNAIRLLMETNLKWHPLMIRSMSHVTLIQIFLRFSDIQNLLHVYSFLSNFPIKDIQEPSSWSILTSRLSKVEYSNAVNFITQVSNSLKDNDEKFKVSVDTLAITIQSLCEAKVIFKTDKCLEIQELNSLFLCLEKVDIRPYVNISCIIKIIDLIHCLINLEFTLPKFIYLLFENYQETMWKFLLKLLNCDDFQYEHIEICTQVLLNISFSKLKIFSANTSGNYEKKLEEKCLKVLTGTYNQHNKAQLLYALKLWCNISHLHVYENEFFYEVINHLLILCKFKTHEDELSRKISSESYQALGLLIHNHLLSFKTNDFKNKDWFRVMSDTLDAAGNEVLVYYGNILRHFASSYNNDKENLQELETLIKSFWNCNFGSKRDKLFWVVIQNLTKCVNSSNFLTSEDLQFVIQEFNTKMLEEGDKLPALKYILMVYSEIDKYFDKFMSVILNGLLHGEALRRDQRVLLQTCSKGQLMLSSYSVKDGKIENFDAYEFLNRQSNVDVTIRAAAVIQLCKSLHFDKKNGALFLPLVLEKLLSIKNKRYFANSYLHRLKHRIMQILLLLQPYLDENSSQILYYALKDSLLQDSEQHSVLMLKKWIFICSYLSWENILSDIWTFFDQICEERPNSANFIISIIWHVSQHLTQTNKTAFLKMALTKLGNCCMGQQFSTRLYGQLFFTKLYEQIEEIHIRQEFSSLYKIILNSLSNNSKKHPIKIDDFFYTVFDAVQDYSLETIYYQLPRLSDISVEEWITTKNFEEVLLEKSIDIRIHNNDSSKYDTISSTVIPKQGENEYAENQLGEISTDFQKKIMPKKPVVLEDEKFDQYFKELDLNSEKKSKNIIVVASLVEKSQNLGGIARTCEIFGSKELVISSLKRTEDKEFQALSVSADQWLKISEIKPDLLSKYLLELKENGWSIIGAEQTINSVSLVNFEFPKQTALVLGNEKSGIPANILPLLDICVEIPQQGVVRSLNVHVTSAICIWEYIKQHQLKTA